MKKALVLSGGGARGAYQVGAYKALKKLNMKFDIITGTSVGALNGIFIVMNKTRKLEKVWKNIKYSNVYGKEFEEELFNKEFITKQIKKYIKNKGMEITGLEELFIKNINLKKIEKSDMDYGLVTFCIEDLKPIYLTKQQLLKGNIESYILASASIFPVFKVKEIEKKHYIDGGYCDQIPVSLALEMGAKEIIAIDLKAPGIIKKIPKDTKVTTISPQNKICSIFTFEKKHAKKLIKYGYNDTLKKYNKLEGNKYTFKKDTINVIYNLYNKKITKEVKKIYLDKRNIKDAFIEDAIITKILLGKSYRKEFLEVIEKLAEILKLDDTKIYNRPIFEYHIKKGYRKLKKKRKNNVLIRIDKNLKNKEIAKNLIHLYSLEFIGVIYLNIIKQNII